MLSYILIETIFRWCIDWLVRFVWCRGELRVAKGKAKGKGGLNCNQ